MANIHISRHAKKQKNNLQTDTNNEMTHRLELAEKNLNQHYKYLQGLLNMVITLKNGKSQQRKEFYKNEKQKQKTRNSRTN